jgi:transposase
MTQTKLKPLYEINPTQNISFPIGTILSVQNCYEKLDFYKVFSKYKKKGRSINSLIQSLVSYKLTDNFSISRGSDWINQKEVLSMFQLKEFEEKTLFRVLGIIGKNREEIIADMQDCIFEKYDFPHTNTNLDWTSLVLYGEKSSLGKYGYSRDHRPDKRQLTVGLAELASPINIPVGITIKSGNTQDMKHFDDTYGQIKRKLKEGSMIVVDKGAGSKLNVEKVLKDKMKYLTSKKLNKSDDKRINNFDKENAILVDKERNVYGIKFTKPSRFDYFFFSESLKQDQLAFKIRKAKQKFEEAKELQKCIDEGKKIPSKYRINNALIDIKYSYQTKLSKLSEKDALDLIEKATINGREGFFCIISNENLTLEEALETYRKKDSIEKIFNSLKNEIEIKPVRVWTDNSIYGALIIGFLAQLFVSLMRYDYKELKQISTKFIKKSLMNLTVTIIYEKNLTKRYVYSNFDAINRMVIAKKQTDT